MSKKLSRTEALEVFLKKIVMESTRFSKEYNTQIAEIRILPETSVFKIIPDNKLRSKVTFETPIID